MPTLCTTISFALYTEGGGVRICPLITPRSKMPRLSLSSPVITLTCNRQELLECCCVSTDSLFAFCNYLTLKITVNSEDVQTKGRGQKKWCSCCVDWMVNDTNGHWRLWIVPSANRTVQSWVQSGPFPACCCCVIHLEILIVLGTV